MKKTTVSILIAVLAMTSGCATRSNNINAEFVPSSQYSGQKCNQLAASMEQKRNSLAELSDSQDKKATADAVLLTTGMLLFWPALLAMPLTGNNKHEIAHCKGEVQAMMDEYNRRCLDTVATTSTNENNSVLID